MQSSNLLQSGSKALLLCGLMLLALEPIAAHAVESGDEQSTAKAGVVASQFYGGPCGLQTLRDQSGQKGDADIHAIWQCAKHVLIPTRYSDSDSDGPVVDKTDGLKWGMRVRHDQLVISVGLKW